MVPTQLFYDLHSPIRTWKMAIRSSSIWLAICIAMMTCRKRALAKILLIAGTTGAIATSSLGQEVYTVENGREIRPLEVFQDCPVCPEMIVLPLGSFMMGAPPEESAPVDVRLDRKPGEPRGRLTEGPVHEVVIDIPIAMGRNEVTHEEWAVCVADGGCSYQPDRIVEKLSGPTEVSERSPVNEVSYLDIQEYIAWLNEKTGSDAYRLPTEAEWEYAARAGAKTKFAQGDVLTPDQANIISYGNITDQGVFSDPDLNSPFMPISVDDLDAANAWGLRHIAGNVLERTLSCWSERHLGLASSSQYLAAALEVQSCDRVGKGGAFNASMYTARPANRGRATEDRRSDIAGFRIVKELESGD